MCFSSFRGVCIYGLRGGGPVDPRCCAVLCSSAGLLMVVGEIVVEAKLSKASPDDPLITLVRELTEPCR